MAYDYVLAGGGSAGATLAARLSEDHKITVCLIEAGGEGRSVVVRAPIGVAAMLSGKPKINNWAFETVPQPGLDGRRGYQPRGKALGGSSAINGMIYVRGHHTDYDDWAALGFEGWSWKEVLPYFKRAEGNERGADVFSDLVCLPLEIVSIKATGVGCRLAVVGDPEVLVTGILAGRGHLHERASLLGIDEKPLGAGHVQEQPPAAA